MRVDESRISAGGRVKVRCPHCSGIGFAAAPSPLARAPRVPVPLAAPPGGQGPAHTPEAPPPAPDRPGGNLFADACEASADGFRFPAERKAVRSAAPAFLSPRRMLVWVGISLAVVAAFALLVNVTLPGPGGARPFQAIPHRDVSSPK